MKKVIMSLTIMLLTVSSVFGVYVEIGTGTSSEPIEWPFFNWFENSKAQTLYLSSEIGDAITFESIGFNIEQVASSIHTELADFTVNFLHTNANALVDGAYHDMTGATQVFHSSSYTLASVTGWNEIDITDFVYNGTQNLIVEIIWGDNGIFTDIYYRNLKTDDGAGIVRTLYGFSDDVTPPDYSGSSTAYSNIRFNYTLAGYPGAPSNPNPEDNAVDVIIEGDLTWDFGADTETYDLWFGLTGAMTEVVTGANAGTAGSYSYSNLDYETLYEWQVIAHNSTDETTNGPVWSFTTVEAFVAEPPTNLLVDELGYATWEAPGGGAEIVVNQLPNQVSALFSDAAFPQAIADNFILDVDTTIEGLVIWGIYFDSNTPVVDDFCVIFHTDDAGAIGTMITTETAVPSVREMTGYQIMGFDEYMHELTLATPVDLIAGTYWLEFYNTTQYPDSDTWGWETGTLDPDHGIVGSAWAETVPGSDWNYNSVTTDLSLQILGVTGVDNLAFTPAKISGDVTKRDINNSVGTHAKMISANSNTPVNNNSKTYNLPNEPTREHLGYNVYLNGIFEVFTADEFYQYTGLINGQTYTAGVSALYDEGESDIIGTEFTYTGTSTNENTISPVSRLIGNYPNPFNPTTTISYSLSEEDAENAKIEIFNLKGQKVKTYNHSELADESVFWNGKDDSGKQVSSGIYLYKLQTGDYSQTKKMILMK